MPLKKEIKTIKGIVLSCVKTKESSAMIDILTPDGLIGVFAHGVYKMGGKSSSLALPLTYGDFSFYEDVGGKKTFKESKLETCFGQQNDLLSALSSSVLIEITKKITSEDNPSFGSEVYSLLLHVLLLEQKGLNPLKGICLFVSGILKAFGTEPFVDGCVRCEGKKGIVSFSIEDGGFVCKDCFDALSEKPISAECLLFIRALFKNKEKIETSDINKDRLIEVLRILLDFLEASSGLVIKSFLILEKTLNRL